MSSFMYPAYLREPEILGVTVFRDGELPVPAHYDDSELFKSIWDEVDYVRSLTDTQLATYIMLVRASAFRAGSYYSEDVDVE